MAFTTFLLLSLFLTNFPPSAVSRAVPDHRLRSEGMTIIRLIDIPDDFNFPNATELIIEGVTVGEWDVFSMFSRLKNTKYLSLINGTIPIITFRSSKLLSLTVLQSDLSLFEVWPERNPTLATLRLTRNRMEIFPPNIRFLVGLTSLDLSQNKLQHVDLRALESMKQLKNLDLSVNKIITIDAPAALRLNRLKNLAVSFNLLERFDAFPEAFPVLDTIRLMGNKWTCEWVDFARKSIMGRRITTFGVDYGCSEYRQGGLCCYGDLKPVSTTEATLLKEGPLLKEVQGLVNDIAENPMKTYGGQSVLELLTRNVGGRNDKILVGVKLDEVKIFF
ncbi:uncharacterized protein LOC135704847 [Ochlerotatus camptorhynchus]|uniref:uncharacterized protein LOC135704847 n=1 Tax=Ochlerotatus camptorhynchus TaxID=644619 RepID=UPI0031DC4D34